MSSLSSGGVRRHLPLDSCLAMRQSHCPSSDKRSGEERGGWRGRRGKATDVTLNYCWRAERRERAEDNLFPPPRRRRLRMEFYPTCKVSLLILKRGTFKQCTSAVSCAELKIEFSRIKTGPGRRVKESQHSHSMTHKRTFYQLCTVVAISALFNSSSSLSLSFSPLRIVIIMTFLWRLCHCRYRR